MKILISNTSDVPLYQQIKDQITDAILRGELKEGDTLPSIRSFSNDLRVSVLTIRRVYDDLEKEGYINSQVGIGTFVSTGNTELLREAKVDVLDEDDVSVRSKVLLAPLQCGVTILGRGDEAEVDVGELVRVSASDRALEENRLAEAVGNRRAGDACGCLVKARDARDALLVQHRPSPGPYATPARWSHGRHHRRRPRRACLSRRS